jgi:hypothetical protein
MKTLLLFGVLASIGFAATPLEFRTTELPWAAVQTVYDLTIATRAALQCEQNEIVFALVHGELPPGLEIGLDGIHGTPVQAGTYRFTLRAANGCSQTTREFTLVVTGKPILRVDAADLVFEHQAGAPDPPARSLLVSSSWPGLPYSVNSAACQWLKFAQTEGRTPPTGSALSADPVWVRVLPSELPPGKYTCNLVFSTWRAANAPVVRVSLEIAGRSTALHPSPLPKPQAVPEPTPTTMPQTEPAVTAAL